VRAKQVDVLILAIECIQPYAFALSMNQIDSDVLIEDSNIGALQYMRL
jgi:hypothetical protein